MLSSIIYQKIKRMIEDNSFCTADTVVSVDCYRVFEDEYVVKNNHLKTLSVSYWFPFLRIIMKIPVLLEYSLIWLTLPVKL